MAVSGRKISDFQSSFSRDSAENFAYCCAPCLIDGQHAGAHGYCLDCSEYLCKNCFQFHKKIKVSRHHQLLGKDNMDKHSSLPKPVNVCTEKCSIHRNEFIKFFCPKHEELGCTDCMTLNHKPCDFDYIPDKCAGIGDSDEYREIVRKLDQKLADADGILKKASGKDKEIEDSHSRLFKDIVEKRKEVNDHFDTIQKNIEADASKKMTTSKQKIKAVVTSCTNVTSNIKKLKSSLQNSKADGQNCQFFIDIKRAKSELQSRELQQAEISLGKTNTEFTFNSSKAIDTVLAMNSFGQLAELKEAVDIPSRPLKTRAVTPRMKGTFNNLQHKTDISLNNNGHITGCAALSSDKLVLADNCMSKLIVVNTNKNSVVEEKVLDSHPWDIAVLPQDQIAVTMPDTIQIRVMTTAGKLSTARSIPAWKDCYGLTYRQNCLYVIYRGSTYYIYVVDMNGNIRNSISLDGMSRVFSSPEYIVLSQDQNKLYISSRGWRCVANVTLQGEVTAVYKHTDLAGPLGIVVLDDGSWLVCCKNNTIHHISADFSQGRKTMDDLNYPRCISYRADKNEVFIAGSDANLKVYSAIFKHR